MTTSNRYQALQPEEAAVFEPDKPDESDIPTSDSQIQRAVINRRPNICITEKCVQNMSEPVTSTVHQEDSTSDKIQQEVASIVSDSMTRSIRVRYFNSHLDERREVVKINKFPAAHANQIRLYSQYTLQVDRPSRIIIATGSNVSYDMATGGADPHVIASRIWDIAQDARKDGVRYIFISGLIKRRGSQFIDIISEINLILRLWCMRDDFNFIDNDNIQLGDLCDGLHLNHRGNVKFIKNLLWCCHSYNPYLNAETDDDSNY